jgi:hypothetical protein
MTTVLNLPDYYAGDSLDLDFAVQKPDGSPEDLTGATVTWSVSVIDRPPATLGEKLVEVAASILDPPTAGNVHVALGVGLLTRPGVHHQQLEVVLQSGKSYTYEAGSIPVKPTIRPTT